MAYSVFQRKLETKHYNYLIFGHRHLPMKVPVGENAEYVNLGDWITYFTYGVFDGDNFEIKSINYSLFHDLQHLLQV
jgi:UDP-2,3-diacylglucosamine hydrolase